MIDIAWTSRLLAATSCSYRLVYLAAIAVFVAVYFFLAIPTDYEVQQAGWISVQPIMLLAMMVGWRAVGHATRPLGFLAIALLTLFAASMIDVVVRLPASRQAIIDFSANFPEPWWHQLATQLGPDGPFIVFLAFSVGMVIVLVAGVASSIVLRLWPRDPSGRTLVAQARHVRAKIAAGPGASDLMKLIRARQWKGWIAAAGAVAVLLAPGLLAGRERAIPDVGGVAGWLPDLVARVITFLNDRAWAAVLAILAAIVLWRRARWYLDPEARLVLDADRRPPILLLRSFKDDHAAVASVALWRRLLDPILWPVRALLAAVRGRRAADALAAVTRRRIEEVAASSLRGIGPFIAVGNRGEGAPELGAFRAELGDDWQPYVERWLREAQLIVLVAGLTDWVQWELRAAAKAGALTRLIVLLPPDSSLERAKRWRLVVECLQGTPWHAQLAGTDPSRVLAACFAPDGRALTVCGSRRTERDYDLAVRMGMGIVLG